LRFISGKYQGGEFPLRMDREIIIGRSGDLDMVLVEDMVSRKHAKIMTTAGDLVISDLGSTNGTFVNGEKIKTGRLREGDRILIGTSIIKVVAVDGHGQPLSDVEARARLEAQSQRRQSTQGRPMSGAIDEIPLPDLLQLLTTSRKSGVLSIRGDRGEHGVGRIYLRKGQIYYASIDENFDTPPRKALFRLLAWQTGSFELEPPDERDVLEEIRESAEALLMEGMRQLDELNNIKTRLPDDGATLELPRPLEAPLSGLAPAELETLQQAWNAGSLRALLDRSKLSDLETATALLKLIQEGYLSAR
jgi:hypothetical protein